MGISTGTQIASNLIGQQSETASYYILFDATSTSLTSHIIDVDDYSAVVTAYNLVTETIEVERVVYIRGVLHSTPVYIQGGQVLLTQDNNVIVLNVSGLYRFKLSAGLGSIIAVVQDATLAMHSNRMFIGS